MFTETTLIAEEIGTPTYTDTENSPGQGYTWKVTVVCTGGGESSPSFIAKDACMTKPAPVTNLDVNYNVDCHAVITWTASANATYYKVLRGTDIIAPNVTATTFTDVESHPAIGYKWSVVACNPAGESTATAVTKDACITLPAPVTDFEVVYTPECHASLTWTATTSNIAIGYKVYRETDLIATINSVDETTYIDEDFENIGHKWLVKILCKFDIESNPAEKQLGVCVGIKDNVKTKFSIIPNPAKNNIAVNAENNFHTIEILSFLGQVVYSQPNVGSQASLDITNLSNGVYFVRIISDSSTSVKKFVKQ